MSMNRPITNDKVWFVVPAFNESQRLESVVKEVSAKYNIVVIDDGSTDSSGAIANKSGAYVLTHSVNLGQGAALQTGIDFALLKSAEIIITFDSDGQHHLSDAETMINVLQNDPSLDVVLGSRFTGKAENIPKLRRVFLKLSVMFTNLTTGLSLTDSHNGLRAFTAKGARNIRITQNKMAHASEILEKISQQKIPFKEIPVTITYTEHTLAKGQKISGASKIVEDLIISRVFK